MAHGDVETFHQDDAWYNRLEGDDGTIGDSYDRRDEAVAAGMEIARERGVDHLARDLDGTVAERTSYRSDSAT